MNEQNPDNSTIDCPAVYRIRVQGSLPTSWSHRVEGMTITVRKQGGGPALTTLVGELADQSSLARVLNTLHGQRLPILSLKRLESRFN